MKKVCLVDHGSNKVYKHAGFSFGYLFFGPLYLICRLRFEGLALLILYFWLLPLPGFPELVSYVTASTGWDAPFYHGICDVVLFFHTSFANSPNPYIGLLIFLLIHLLLSFKADNSILKRTIRKKKLAPFSEQDARTLIYYHVCHEDVLLAGDVARNEHLYDQAEKAWEDKNLTFTTMLNRADIMKAEEKIPEEKLTEAQRHKRNADLLEKGVINKEQYDILEKRRSAK